MLQDALKGGYAIGQFNINTLSGQRLSNILVKKKSLSNLRVSEGAGKYMGGFNTVVGMVEGMIKDLGDW